jgi:hypothetical protein
MRGVDRQTKDKLVHKKRDTGRQTANNSLGKQIQLFCCLITHHSTFRLRRFPGQVWPGQFSAADGLKAWARGGNPGSHQNQIVKDIQRQMLKNGTRYLSMN